MVVISEERWIPSIVAAVMKCIVLCIAKPISASVNTKLCMIERTEVVVVVRLIHRQMS
jgi:hypothetical protein